jgi:hypothetical protein
VLQLFSPAWLLRHGLALGLVGFFIFMGHWQWTKGQSSRGTLQNLFYGIEWWIFTAFVLFLWGKMILEHFRPSTPAPGTAGLGDAPEAAGDAATPAATPRGGTDVPTAGAPAGVDARTWALVAGSAVARPDAPLVMASVAVPASLTATPADDEDPEDAELAAYNQYLTSLRTRGR